MTTSSHTRNGRAGRGAILSLALSMLLASLGTSIANIALPSLAAALDAPFHQVQWVVIAYLAGLTAFSLVAGRLGDVFGHRRMLLAGLALFAVASAACGLSGSIGMLIAARLVQGTAAAMLMTLTIALVRDVAASGGAGLSMGLLGTMSAVGTALGPSLGGVVVAAYGWRAAFWVLVPLGLAALALAATLLPRDLERSTRAQRLRLADLGEPVLAARLGANILVAATMMATLVVGPFVLGPALGLSEAQVGLVMAVGPVISMLSGVPAGRLVDLRGPLPVSVLGLAALALGAFALAVLPAFAGVAGYLAAIVMLTPGYQLFQAANNTAVVASGAADRRGHLSGLLNLSRNLGLIAGASLLGALFALGAGVPAIEAAARPAILDGLRLTFAVAGLMMLAALWLTLAFHDAQETAKS